jgi:serine phosphatase RsbU (regulator of sigma subunit)
MTSHPPDPAVVEAVEHVRDRFGAHGLRDMIVLAQQALQEAEAALEELAHLDDEEPQRRRLERGES